MNKQFQGGLLQALLCLALCLFFAAAHGQESLYVVDQANNAVHVFNEADGGGYVDGGDFATSGLNSPAGIAVGSDGSVYVTNLGANTVNKFDSHGRDLGAVIFANLNVPFAIAINSLGQIAVANRGSNTVLFDGVTLSSGINDPSGLAFAANGDLLISNRGDDTIRRYSGTTDMGVFAAFGLSEPTGLAVDENGNVYAANYKTNSIRKFDDSGSDLGAVFFNNLNGPLAIAYSINRGLAVSNSISGTVSPGIPGFSIGNPNGLAFGPTPVPAPNSMIVALFGLPPLVQGMVRRRTRR